MFIRRPQPVAYLALMALLTAPLALGEPPASAAPGARTPAPESKPAVKIAVTPQDHLEKAAEYRKKAAGNREEADMHRKMLLDYKKRLPPDTRQGNYEAPELKKMRIHCEGYIRDAEALAASAEKFAEYHEMRAAELRGK